MNLCCSCGARFRSMMDEAKHRHNFPLLCRKSRVRRATVQYRGLLELLTVANALESQAHNFPRGSDLSHQLIDLAHRANKAADRWIEKHAPAPSLPAGSRE